MDTLKLLNKETFTQKVITLIEEKQIPAMEAIIICADELNLELETISRLIDKSLKEKVESEAVQLKLLKRGVETLPI